MGEGRKYLTGRKWELIGYSWRQSMITEKWDVMRVFGDGSSDPAEFPSYGTRDEAHSAAEALAMKKKLPVFPPEKIYAVFFELGKVPPPREIKPPGVTIFPPERR